MVSALSIFLPELTAAVLKLHCLPQATGLPKIPAPCVEIQRVTHMSPM